MTQQESPKCALNTKSFINDVDEYSPFRLANALIPLISLFFSNVSQKWTWMRNGRAALRLLSLLQGIRCVHYMRKRCGAFLIYYPEMPLQREIQGRICKEIYWVEYKKTQPQSLRNKS